MILIAPDERRWLLRNLALGLFEYLGVAEPPVPVEALLRHPPRVLQEDVGLVEMYSNLWDATFARMTDQRGSIFVRVDLSSHERRFALARELLRALVTSEHGRAMGLPEILLPDLQECAEYFARQLLAPEALVAAYRKRGGSAAQFSLAFDLPAPVAALRWEDASALN
jgi:Zn-dependent peptidase ImmA (M78 family)